jgi:hypothetical protein
MFYHSLTLSLQAKVIVVMATDTGAWDFYDKNQSGGDRMAALLRLPDIQLSSEIRCGVSTHIRYSWFDVTTLPERERETEAQVVVICFIPS